MNWIFGMGTPTRNGRDDKAPTLMKALEGHTGTVECCGFSPSGEMMVSGSVDNTLRVWETSSWECVKKLEGHTNWVLCCGFSPSGEMMVSGSWDRTLRVWETSSWECVKKLEGHTKWVLCCGFSPSGEMMVSGSEDKTLRVWETSTWECVKKLEGHTNWVRCCGFSPSGEMMVSGSGDNTLRVWDMMPERRVFGIRYVIQKTERQNNRQLEAALRKLDEMIGMRGVKEAVAELVNTWTEYPDERPQYFNFVLLGPPGTGKTSVAAVIAEIVVALGLLGGKQSGLVHIGPNDLCAPYTSQTADKAQRFLESMIGRVLFYDEAGSFTKGNQYANEAASAINRFWEAHPGQTCFIVAGYKEELDKHFFSADPSWKSKFPNQLCIEEYSVAELASIFMQMVAKKQWRLGSSCTREVLEGRFRQYKDTFASGGQYSNARGVESMLRMSVHQQAKRSNKEKYVFELEDIDNALQDMLGLKPSVPVPPTTGRRVGGLAGAGQGQRGAVEGGEEGATEIGGQEQEMQGAVGGQAPLAQEEARAELKEQLEKEHAEAVARVQEEAERKLAEVEAEKRAKAEALEAKEAELEAKEAEQRRTAEALRETEERRVQEADARERAEAELGELQERCSQTRRRAEFVCQASVLAAGMALQLVLLVTFGLELMTALAITVVGAAVVWCFGAKLLSVVCRLVWAAVSWLLRILPPWVLLALLVLGVLAVYAVLRDPLVQVAIWGVLACIAQLWVCNWIVEPLQGSKDKLL